MRIQLASDLHLEILAREFPGVHLLTPAEGADLLVLAGDIDRGSAAIETFKDWPVPVLYVAGNHEGYHECWDSMLIELANRAQGTSVRFLEHDIADFGDVRFLGCTLWTDYCLWGTNTRAAAMENAERTLYDHRVIRTSDGGQFSAAEALRNHERACSWLRQELARPYDGKTVVITHHGPHPLSVHPRYDGDMTSATFISDLTELVEKADYWFHGHTHDSFDYIVGGCRVVANPRGYPLNRRSAKNTQELEFENPNFQQACVIDTTTK